MQGEFDTWFAVSVEGGNFTDINVVEGEKFPLHICLGGVDILSRTLHNFERTSCK